MLGLTNLGSINGLLHTAFEVMLHLIDIDKDPISKLEGLMFRLISSQSLVSQSSSWEFYIKNEIIMESILLYLSKQV